MKFSSEIELFFNLWALRARSRFGLGVFFRRGALASAQNSKCGRVHTQHDLPYLLCERAMFLRECQIILEMVSIISNSLMGSFGKGSLQKSFRKFQQNFSATFRRIFTPFLTLQSLLFCSRSKEPPNKKQGLSYLLKP